MSPSFIDCVAEWFKAFSSRRFGFKSQLFKECCKRLHVAQNTRRFVSSNLTTVILFFLKDFATRVTCSHGAKNEKSLIFLFSLMIKIFFKKKNIDRSLSSFFIRCSSFVVFAVDSQIFSEHSVQTSATRESEHVASAAATAADGKRYDAASCRRLERCSTGRRSRRATTTTTTAATNDCSVLVASDRQAEAAAAAAAAAATATTATTTTATATTFLAAAATHRAVVAVVDVGCSRDHVDVDRQAESAPNAQQRQRQ